MRHTLEAGCHGTGRDADRKPAIARTLARGRCGYSITRTSRNARLMALRDVWARAEAGMTRIRHLMRRASKRLPCTHPGWFFTSASACLKRHAHTRTATRTW